MDWKIAASAFTTLFLAEMGDKTQLAAMTMAASTGRPLSVLAGGSLALIAVTGVGVLLGQGLLSVVSEAALRRASGAAFVALGLWTWLRA